MLVEKIIVFFLFFPLAIFSTITNAIYNLGRETTLKDSGKQIEERGKWEKAAELPTSRYEFGVGAVGENVFLVGGLFLPSVYTATGRVEIYNTKKNDWRMGASLPFVIHHAGVTSDQKYIYVIGGDGFRVTPLNIAYRYDPAKDEWEKLPDMPTKRGALGLVELDGKIYAVGGAAYNKKSGALEVYNVQKRAWSERMKKVPFI